MCKALELWVVSGGDKALHALPNQTDNGGDEVLPGEGAEVRCWAALKAFIMQPILLGALKQAPLDGFQELWILNECLHHMQLSIRRALKVLVAVIVTREGK